MSGLTPSSNPWEELAQQASRSSRGERERAAERDRALRAAVLHGSSVRELADQIGLTPQAVYQALERAEREAALDAGSGYDQTIAALQGLTDGPAFERLSMILLGRFMPDLRPTQLSGDRGQDGVASPDVRVVCSLAKDWAGKIRSDVRRIAHHSEDRGHVVAVTSRPTTVGKVDRLRDELRRDGWDLTVFDAHWIATQLAQPECMELRAEVLHLSPPAPRFFLTLEQAVEVAERAQPSSPEAFVGREDQLDELGRRLAEDTSVVLVAPGGWGKSRLMLELAQRERRWRWFFVRDGLPFSRDVLPELGVDDDVAIVVDDAHRREDLRSLLAGIERHSPTPRVVIVTRPGFDGPIDDALAQRALGAFVRTTLRPLTRSEVADLLRQPPIEVRYDGLRDSIIELAEGIPQIAIIAGQLASRGLTLHELSRDDTLRQYAGAVLRDAVGDRRERIALIALVAAAGQLRLDGPQLAAAADLLGMLPPHVRREVTDLADHGTLVSDGLTVSIKPDLLAERMLLGCFFDRTWDPALGYDEVYRALAPSERVRMLSTLGQALRHAGDGTERSPQLTGVRDDLLAACATVDTADQLVLAAELVAAVAPGMPELALACWDRLVERMPDEAVDRPVSALTELLARVATFEDQWPRLLDLACRVAASPATKPATGQVDEAFRGIHQRLPVRQSQYDGWILARVQELMAELTAAFWRSHHDRPGAADAVALASRSLLTVTFETHRRGGENPDEIRLLSVGLAATEQTRRCLTTGAELLLATLQLLDLPDQLRQVEALRGLAHPALGFDGPLGLAVGDATQQLVNELFDTVVEPWFCEHLDALPLPTAAEVLGLFEWRTHFGRPPHRLVADASLRAYRDLLAPPASWDFGHESVEQQLAARRRTAEDHVVALLADAQPLTVLDRWSGWYVACVEATGQAPDATTVGLALEIVAERDPSMASEMVDHLLAVDSPLLVRVSAAMASLLRHQPQLGAHWARTSSVDGLCALAWAVHTLPDPAQHELVERLAQAPQLEVRHALARALSHRRQPTTWSAEVALRLARDDADAHVLWRTMAALEVSSELMCTAGDQLVRLAREAVLETARQPLAGSGHEIGETLRILRRLGDDILWSWVWARIDWLGSTESSIAHGLADSVLALVAEDAEVGADAQLTRALDRLEAPRRPYVVTRALLDLVRMLDHDSEELTDRLRRWATNRDALRTTVREILELPAGWDTFARRATAVLDADSSTEAMHVVLWAREPSSFMGSRVPYYERAKAEFATWQDDADGRLVRLATLAEQYFDARIEEARGRDQERRDRYGS